MSHFYVSNWKSSYDVDNEMARNIVRVKLKTIISFNSENSVIHRYLYNTVVYPSRISLFKMATQPKEKR